MNWEAALSLLHGADYALSAGLLGHLIFKKWIVRELLGHPSRTGGRAAALALFCISILWFVAVSHDMSESWVLSDLWVAGTSTTFGHYWCLRILLLGVGVLLVFYKQTTFAVGVLVIALLGYPMVGHAGAEAARIWTNVAFDLMHLLAVSVWTGGLVSLFFWLRGRVRNSNGVTGLAYPVVVRFSHFAQVSAVVIAISGAAMAYRYGVSPWAPWASAYGKVVLLKSGLFGAALAAAAVNQFIHIRNWKAEQDAAFTRAICREVALEIALVFLVFIAAGFLTRMEMPNIPL